ncbi:MAG: hypothetical protein IS860_02720 [Nitrosopumilus sp.]|nr:hypothetical protein [Nitrosopumilus sp.]
MIELLLFILAFGQTYEDVEIFPDKVELLRGISQSVRISGYLGDSNPETFVLSITRPDGVNDTQIVGVTNPGTYDSAYLLSWDMPAGRYDVNLLLNGTSFVKTSFVAFVSDEDDAASVANLVSISFDSKNIQCKNDGDCYSPQNFYIRQHESVVWENADQSVHTVTSGIIIQRQKAIGTLTIFLFFLF